MKSFEEIQVVLFKNLTSSGARLKSTRGGKENLLGKRMGISSAHLGTLNSGTYQGELVSLIDG